MPHSSPEVPGWFMNPSHGTQILHSWERAVLSGYICPLEERHFFLGLGGKPGGEQLVSFLAFNGWLCRDSCALEARGGNPPSVPTPVSLGDPGIQGTSCRARSLKQPQQLPLQPSYPFLQSGSSSAFMSMKVMRTAQWEHSQKGIFQKYCLHSGQCSKFYQKEQERRDWNTFRPLSGHSTPLQCHFHSPVSGTTLGDFKFWMLTGR